MNVRGQREWQVNQLSRNDLHVNLRGWLTCPCIDSLTHSGNPCLGLAMETRGRPEGRLSPGFLQRFVPAGWGLEHLRVGTSRGPPHLPERHRPPGGGREEQAPSVQACPARSSWDLPHVAPLSPAGPGFLTGSPTRSPVPSAPLCPHLPAGTAAPPASAEVASAGSIKRSTRTLQLFRLSQHPFNVHSGSTYFLRGTV